MPTIESPSRTRKGLSVYFKLKELDDYGQRINIEITLPNKVTGETVTVISGWMVYPDGTITNATPCRGGK